MSFVTLAGLNAPSLHIKNKTVYAPQLNSSHLSSEDSSDHYSFEKDLRNDADNNEGISGCRYELGALIITLLQMYSNVFQVHSIDFSVVLS